MNTGFSSQQLFSDDFDAPDTPMMGLVGELEASLR